MRIFRRVLFSAADASVSANSAACQIGEIGGSVVASVCAKIAGSGTGTMVVQFSNDIPDGTSNFAPTNWYTAINSAGSSSSASIDSSTNYVYFSPPMSAQWLRVAYTRSGGSGTITCHISIAGVTH